MNQAIVDIHGLRGEKRVVIAEEGQSVYVADAIDTYITVKGKCVKVVIIDVKKCFIFVESTIANIEIMRMKESTFVLGQGSMINAESCTECSFGLGSENTEIRLRKSVLVSVSLLLDSEFSALDAESVEQLIEEKEKMFLPEEISVRIENKKPSSSLVIE